MHPARLATPARRAVRAAWPLALVIGGVTGQRLAGFGAAPI